MIVHIYEGDQKGSIEWCKKNFDDIVEVKGPTIAALHRAAYDPLGYTAVVFYFRDEVDYFHFLLKWS